MTISIDKSIEQEKNNTTSTTIKTRQSTYKINPLILNRWFPRSMTLELYVTPPYFPVAYQF
jgi:hypothetical protein